MTVIPVCGLHASRFTTTTLLQMTVWHRPASTHIKYIMLNPHPNHAVSHHPATLHMTWPHCLPGCSCHFSCYLFSWVTCASRDACIPHAGKSLPLVRCIWVNDWCRVQSALQIKTWFVGKDHHGDAPLISKIGAGLTAGAVAITIASPTDLVKVSHTTLCQCTCPCHDLHRWHWAYAAEPEPALSATHAQVAPTSHKRNSVLVNPAAVSCISTCQLHVPDMLTSAKKVCLRPASQLRH